MSWKEHDLKSRILGEASRERAEMLDKVKSECLPVVQKEADTGLRPFKPIDFQTVRSPGRYEGEFGIKENDLIFHFWPYGYHSSEHEGTVPPRFAKLFEKMLTQAFHQTFDSKRVSISFDEDVGSFFIKANGYAINQFNRELSIKACETLHKLLGGTD